MSNLSKSVTTSHILKQEGKPPPFVSHSTKTKMNSISSQNGDKIFNNNVSPTLIQRKAIDLSSTSTKSANLSDTISLDNEGLDSPPNVPPPPPPLMHYDSNPLLESIPPPIPDSDSSSSSSSEEEEREEKIQKVHYPVEDEVEEKEKEKEIHSMKQSLKSPLKRLSSKTINKFTPIKIIPKIDDTEFVNDLQKYKRIISSFSQQLENLNNEFEVNKLTVKKNIENHHTELYKKYKEDVEAKIKNVEKEITTDLEERRRIATNARTEIKKDMDIRNEKKEGSMVDIWILRMFRLYHAFIVYSASFIYIFIIVPLLKIRKFCSKNDGKDKSHK